MSNRELDRILKERLEHFELEPPMHLWDQIAAARDAKRPLRPWVWWGGGLVVLALSLSFGLWFLAGQTSWRPETPDLSGHKAGADILPAVETPPATANLPEAPGPEVTPEKKAITPVGRVVNGNFAAPVGELPAKNFVAGLTNAQISIAGTPSAPEHVSVSMEKVSPFDGLQGAGLKQIDRAWLGEWFPERTCNSFAKEKWKLHWNAELVASPEYVFRSLSSKSQEFADYARSRDKMEEIRGGFSTGVRISASTDFGVSVRTGLQYGQINEVLNYRDPNDVRIVVNTVYDLEGNIIGTDTTYVAGTHVVVTYNRHRMIDVPLMAGYEFQFPRFSMAVHGGVFFNLLFSQKGKILGPDGEPVSVSSGLQRPYPAFRDKLGLSLAGSIGFNYRLTPELQFIVEPQFRLLLDPVTRPGYSLNQDYFLTGVTLGVRKKI